MPDLGYCHCGVPLLAGDVDQCRDCFLFVATGADLDDDSGEDREYEYE